MERGGPEGALVLFKLKAIDNSLAESLAQDGTVIEDRGSTICWRAAAPNTAKADAMSEAGKI